jgi:hypothetical protein
VQASKRSHHTRPADNTRFRQPTAAADQSESRCGSEPYVISVESKPPLFRVKLGAKCNTWGASDDPQSEPQHFREVRRDQSKSGARFQSLPEALFAGACHVTVGATA